MNTKRLILCFLATTILVPVLSAKEVEFFLSDEPVHIRLEAPISQLKKQRGEDPEWLEGRVAVTDAEGVEQYLDVKVVARGNFRRKRSSCSFPPYWMNFKKKQVKGTVFEDLDKVKVVAHCRETRKSFEPYIFKEYLAYKTYNLLTDRSFRVRMVYIDYYDSDRKKKLDTYAAFFIEHVKSFEKRQNVKQVKDRYIFPSTFDAENLGLADLFQYMLGNSDFSFFASTDECCHNAKVFAPKDGSGVLMPVPYDFDMTGLVDAPYAKVNPKIPISSIRERYYRGMRVSDEAMGKVLARYQEQREAIMSLWENADYLTGKHRAESLEYMEEFYETLDDPRAFEIQIRKKMRSMDKLEEVLESRISELEDSQ